jgi:Ni/Co efflux regulator RcnB
MKRMLNAFALTVLTASLAGVPALAQDHQDQGRHDQAQSQDRHENSTYRQHNEWKKGSRVQQEDWNRGDKVDYRANHLRRPPADHEWRQIDGNFVLANHEGVIFSVQTGRNH